MPTTDNALALRAVEALERIANATERSAPKTLADQFKALPRADRDRFVDQLRGFLEEG